MLDLKKLFGSSNDRKVKAMLAKVAAINALEPQISNLSDDELRAKTEAEARRAKEADKPVRPEEIGGRSGPDPTRYGDWEKKGIVTDF